MYGSLGIGDVRLAAQSKSECNRFRWHGKITAKQHTQCGVRNDMAMAMAFELKTFGACLLVVR